MNIAKCHEIREKNGSVVLDRGWCLSLKWGWAWCVLDEAGMYSRQCGPIVLEVWRHDFSRTGLTPGR